MKPKGATLEGSRQREQDLLQKFHEYRSTCKHFTMEACCRAIVNQPSKHFWTSTKHAAEIINKLIKGQELTQMRPRKRQMFQDIYQRVMALKQQHPHYSIYRCCEIVIAQPAPQFYLSPHSAKDIIRRYYKRWIQEQLEGL